MEETHGRVAGWTNRPIGGCHHDPSKVMDHPNLFTKTDIVVRRLYKSRDTPSLVTQVTDNVTNLKRSCPDSI